MEILKSIFGLTKSNNGFFKSEKQANFLISKMESLEGCIGHVNSGYHSCPVFANWDEKGITNIIKSSKNGDVVMFERKKQGVLTSLEIKEIKSLERKIKMLEKDIKRRQLSFDDGTYNGSGDIKTYDANMIKNFNYFQEDKKQQVENLKNRIHQLKK